MNKEEQKDQLSTQPIDNEHSLRKLKTRSILSHKASKRDFSRRLVTDQSSYKLDDTDNGNAKDIKMVKSQIGTKPNQIELTNMFHKNFSCLKQSMNLKRKKKEHRKNKLSEPVEFSEKYTRAQRVNMSTLSSKISGKAKKITRKFLYSQNQSEYHKSKLGISRMGSIKTNYSEVGSKFGYKIGRSPREIMKDRNLKEKKKKGMFTKSNNKNMLSTNKNKKLEIKKSRQLVQAQNTNGINKINKKYKDSLRIGTTGSVKANNQSFKSETGEFGSVSRKNFGNLDFQTSVTNKWKNKEKQRDTKKGSNSKINFGQHKRNEKTTLDNANPEFISIYKDLEVNGIQRKVDGKRSKGYRKEHVKSREITVSRAKKNREKDVRGYSKVSRKRNDGSEIKRLKKNSIVDAIGHTQESIKTTPDKKKDKKINKYRQGSKKNKSKSKSKSKKKHSGKGKSFEKEETSNRSNTKRNKSRSKKKKKKISYDKKKFLRKNTFQEKKLNRTAVSKHKTRRLNRGKKSYPIKNLNSNISQTMSKPERTTTDLSALPKKSLLTSRNPGESSKKRLREKSQKHYNNNFKNRLKGKDFSQTGKIKGNHSLQKKIRKDVSIEHSRNKKFRKNQKKKNSMNLKNLNDLSKGLIGDVKVIYKGGEKSKKKITQGLYTKKKYVFSDIKKNVDRDQLIGNKMEMIYKQERGSRKKEEGSQKKNRRSNAQCFREIPHIDTNTMLMDETPNIYNQQQNISQIQRESEKRIKKDNSKTEKYINVNEKKIRVSGFRKDSSTQKRRKLTSNRKLSSLSKIVRNKRSKEKNFRSYKNNLKNKLGFGLSDLKGKEKEKRRHRDSFSKKSDSKQGSNSKLYTPLDPVSSSKTNIYKKTGPEFNFPKSEIEFEGKNVQSSIYIKSEEIKQPDEGTTISEKTENSLACQENISKRLQVSQSPDHLDINSDKDRRWRQSTKNPDQEGKNLYFKTEKVNLDYAKSEDLNKEGRNQKNNVKGICSGDLIMAQPSGLGDVTSLEDKDNKLISNQEVIKDKKIQLSQSDAGNWKGMVKSKFKGAKSGDFDILQKPNIISPDLMPSPPGSDVMSRGMETQGNIYVQKNNSSNFESSQIQPMEFEVDVPVKFESLGKGKSSASNRTNKFNYGAKKESEGNLLGESDYTIGKKINRRDFKYQSGEGEFNVKEEFKADKHIEESSEEGEDLIIGNSVTMGTDLEAYEKLPLTDLDMEINIEKDDELEALESLSKELIPESQKETHIEETNEANNYLTLKAVTNLKSGLTRNLSENEIQDPIKNKNMSLNKWKGRTRDNKRRRDRQSKNKRNQRKYNRLDKKKQKNKRTKSRSNSKVKLYKMTSERNSAINNSVSRKDTKTKWSGKKNERKQEINRLLEKYSKEDNEVEEDIKTKSPNKLIPVAFSSTFGTNLHQQLRKAKQKSLIKSKKKIDKEKILQKCKEFKHETQSNLFEVETLNTLTRAEDDYVAKPEYLNLNQPYLDAKVRTVLMGWMGEVSEDLWFCRDTFHMSCNYVDRFLQLTPNVPKDQLQLIGLTCLYIASKMEEVQMRNVNDYLSSACNIYTEDQMMKCEIQIITVLNFKLNPPTLNLWANWYMNQWDNFIFSDTFVQEHPMIRDSQIVAQFKQGNEESYNLYREFMQYLDCAVLDIQTLEYKQYLLVPSFMYIVLGMKYQQFSLEQIVEEFPTSSIYLLSEEEYAFNNLFGYFMYYYFGIELIDLLPTIQYASTYFYFSIELRLPSIIDYKRDEISDGHYEQFISYQIWNKKSVAYVAKLRIPEH